MDLELVLEQVLGQDCDAQEFFLNFPDELEDLALLPHPVHPVDALRPSGRCLDMSHSADCTRCSDAPPSCDMQHYCLTGDLPKNGEKRVRSLF
jgi:hypothetical protein